jgi:hypothetical protein
MADVLADGLPVKFAGHLGWGRIDKCVKSLAPNRELTERSAGHHGMARGDEVDERDEEHAMCSRWPSRVSHHERWQCRIPCELY